MNIILNKQVDTKNFNIHFFNEKDGVIQGSFEHNQYGEDVGGGLWVRDHELFDYDGVHNLPEEVIQTLVKQFKISCGAIQS